MPITKSTVAHIDRHSSWYCAEPSTFHPMSFGTNHADSSTESAVAMPHGTENAKTRRRNPGM